LKLVRDSAANSVALYTLAESMMSPIIKFEAQGSTMIANETRYRKCCQVVIIDCARSLTTERKEKKLHPEKPIIYLFIYL